MTSNIEKQISLVEKWIPLTELQSYFNYRPTQMAALLKSKELIVSKVGKRKFILRESIDRFLESRASNV